jgi:hypothetical protein
MVCHIAIHAFLPAGRQRWRADEHHPAEVMCARQLHRTMAKGGAVVPPRAPHAICYVHQEGADYVRREG